MSSRTLKTYIGTKKVIATPMNRMEYNVYRGWEVPKDENPQDEGYLVEYTDGLSRKNDIRHEGYISWSPKDVFEHSYHEVDAIPYIEPKTRITPSDIQEKIDTVFYLYHETLTICVMKLKNEFIVTGQSACASPKNYIKAEGERTAYNNAFEKIWELEGYLLRENLYQESSKV